MAVIQGGGQWSMDGELSHGPIEAAAASVTEPLYVPPHSSPVCRACQGTHTLCLVSILSLTLTALMSTSARLPSLALSASAYGPGALDAADSPCPTQ